MNERWLSIVVTASNDKYFGLERRLKRSLEAFYCNLHSISELVFVEWNPFREFPLRSPQIAHRWPHWARCFVVTDEFAELGGNRQFAEYPAKNVGIRRGRGKFILSTNADIVLSQKVTNRLLSRSLMRGVSYRAQRLDLPREFNWEGGDIDPVATRGAILRGPDYAPGDFALMDKDSWYRLRGHMESEPDLHYHKDTLLNHKARHGGMSTEHLGIVYHWAHASRPGIRQTPMIDCEVYLTVENDEHWGLAHAIEEVHEGVTYLRAPHATPSLEAVSKNKK
jgi:hypothetical protein